MILLLCLLVVMSFAALAFLWVPIYAKRHEQAMQPLALVIISFTLIVTASVLYLYWGDSQHLRQFYAQKAEAVWIKKVLTHFKSPEEVIEKLRARLEQRPDSAKGWYLLGRLYISHGYREKAYHAFARAYAIKPDDSTIFTNFAIAELLAKGKLSQGSRKKAENELSKAPNMPDLLQLLAVNAYHKTQYQQALDYWRRLLILLPANSNAYSEVTHNIQLARTHLNKHPVQLRVQVTLAKALLKRVKPDETVFIYAKAFGGPAMPLAIARKQVKDLPLQLTFDDSDAMNPNYTLSSCKQVIVEARVSHNGQAKPEPGDLLGKTKLITIAKQQKVLRIVINKRLN